MMTQPPLTRFPDPILTPWHDASCGIVLNQMGTAPSSGGFTTANRAYLYPVRLHESMTVAKAFVLNGATVGTDSWDIGL